MNQLSTRNQFQSICAYLVVLAGLITALVFGGLIWRGDFSVQVAALAAAIAISGAWWVWRGLFRRAALPHLPFDLALAAAVLILFGLWARSPDPRAGLGRVSTLLAYLLLFYILIDVFDASARMRSASLAAVLTLTGLVLLAAVLEVYVVYSNWWQAVGGLSIRPPFPYRLVSLVGHSNSFMGLVNLTAPLAVVTLFRTRRRSVRAAATAWLLCYFAAMPFTSSRGGWLGAAAWMFVLLVFWVWKLRGLHSAPIQAFLHGLRVPGAHRLRTWVYLAVPAFLAAAVYAVYRFYIAFAAHPSHGGSLTGGRDQIWSTALAIWRASPLLGSGPGRFAFEYVTQSASLPPGFWALHAHGLVFTILGEFGLLGMAAFLLFAIWGGIWTVRRVFAAVPERLPLSLAALAGVAGWLAQMVFDDQTAVPAVMVPLVLILAWTATSAPNPLARQTRFPAAWLGLPAVLLAAGAAWSLWAYSPLASALASSSYSTGASRGAAGSAVAEAAAESASRDPSLAYYSVEAGLAWANAWLANAEPADLEKAREAFQHAIDREPSLSWNIANLAVLDGLSGDTQAAISGLETAGKRAPSEPSYALNLAYWYERSGEPDLARQAYTRALDLSPDWASHPFWTLTPLRASVLSDWHKTYPDETAEAYTFERASAALAAGDELGMRRWMAESEWLQEPAAGRGLVRAAGAKSAAGRTAALEDLLASSANDRNYWFSNLTNTYTLWLYARRGLPGVLVPGYVLLDPDYGQYAAFDRLAASYRASGDCPNASRVWIQTQRLIHGGAVESIDPPPTCE